MKLFSIDGPVYKFLSRLWDILRLDLCFVIGALPAAAYFICANLENVPLPVSVLVLLFSGFFIGASATASFVITLKMAAETEGYIFKPFIKAYKENFLKGGAIGSIHVLLIQAAFLSFQIFNATEDGNTYFLIMAILCTVMAVFAFIYAYPLTARYENTIPGTLKNSLRISVRYIGRTLLAVIIVALLIAVFSWNSTLIFIGLLIAPGTIFLAISGIVNYIFADIERKNKEE
ncbi:MAG: DUF624 domain-containing protein [Lachnospiraceae bacterium]|nr:DUF624 domain-containing protein [Lachnospiraceae bacterium]